MTLVGKLVLAGDGEGVEVWLGVRGEACFGIWLEVGTLAELKTGCKQGVGLWDLLSKGTDVIGMGEGEGVGVRVWIAVGVWEITGERVCVGVWEGVEVRVRVA